MLLLPLLQAKTNPETIACGVLPIAMPDSSVVLATRCARHAVQFRQWDVEILVRHFLGLARDCTRPSRVRKRFVLAVEIVFVSRLFEDSFFPLEEPLPGSTSELKLRYHGWKLALMGGTNQEIVFSVVAPLSQVIVFIVGSSHA